MSSQVILKKSPPTPGGAAEVFSHSGEAGRKKTGSELSSHPQEVSSNTWRGSRNLLPLWRSNRSLLPHLEEQQQSSPTWRGSLVEANLAY